MRKMRLAASLVDPVNVSRTSHPLPVPLPFPIPIHVPVPFSVPTPLHPPVLHQSADPAGFFICPTPAFSNRPQVDSKKVAVEVVKQKTKISLNAENVSAGLLSKKVIKGCLDVIAVPSRQTINPKIPSLPPALVASASVSVSGDNKRKYEHATGKRISAEVLNSQGGSMMKKGKEMESRDMVTGKAIAPVSTVRTVQHVRSSIPSTSRTTTTPAAATAAATAAAADRGRSRGTVDAHLTRIHAQDREEGEEEEGEEQEVVVIQGSGKYDATKVSAVLYKAPVAPPHPLLIKPSSLLNDKDSYFNSNSPANTGYTGITPLPPTAYTDSDDHSWRLEEQGRCVHELPFSSPPPGFQLDNQDMHNRFMQDALSESPPLPPNHPLPLPQIISIPKATAALIRPPPPVTVKSSIQSLTVLNKVLNEKEEGEEEEDEVIVIDRSLQLERDINRMTKPSFEIHDGGVPVNAQPYRPHNSDLHDRKNCIRDIDSNMHDRHGMQQQQRHRSSSTSRGGSLPTTRHPSEGQPNNRGPISSPGSSTAQGFQSRMEATERSASPSQNMPGVPGKGAVPCRYFGSFGGCQFGDACPFGHFLSSVSHPLHPLQHPEPQRDNSLVLTPFQNLKEDLSQGLYGGSSGSESYATHRQTFDQGYRLSEIGHSNVDENPFLPHYSGAPAPGRDFGPGAGPGQRTGPGQDFGPNQGIRTGQEGMGDGPGQDFGPSHGMGMRWGPGQEMGPGQNFGPGLGMGTGPRQDFGSSQGMGPGQGLTMGLGQGMGPGRDFESSRTGPGLVWDQGRDLGSGQGMGPGPGQDFGPGQGMRTGQGMGPGPGQDFGPGQGMRTGPGMGPGPGQDFGSSQGMGIEQHQGIGIGMGHAQESNRSSYNSFQDPEQQFNLNKPEEIPYQSHRN